MGRHSFAVRAVGLTVCMFLFTSLVQAQFRASLRGTVSDSQGAK